MIHSTEQPGTTTTVSVIRWVTFRVFADVVVLGVAVVVIPLEQETIFFVGRCGGLVVQSHTHFPAARRLIPMPVPTTSSMQVWTSFK